MASSCDAVEYKAALTCSLAGAPIAPGLRPLKRGGGRRYYRPEDIDLLRRIRTLLYDDGYTIKGVQRLLKESRGRLPQPQRLDLAAESVRALGIVLPSVALSPA